MKNVGPFDDQKPDHFLVRIIDPFDDQNLRYKISRNDYLGSKSIKFPLVISYNVVTFLHLRYLILTQVLAGELIVPGKHWIRMRSAHILGISGL